MVLGGQACSCSGGSPFTPAAERLNPHLVSGLGIRDDRLGSGFWGLRFRVEGFGFKVEGLGFRVQGLGFRV